MRYACGHDLYGNPLPEGDAPSTTAMCIKCQTPMMEPMVLLEQTSKRPGDIDHSAFFIAGFNAAKAAAIQCARQSEYWGNCVQGCKAVRHSIEFMQMLDASRFNVDGTLAPETYVEYDREKHGPIVNGKVKI